MSDLHPFYVQLSPDRIAEAHYRIDGSLLVVTDPNGSIYTLEDGSRLEHRLKDGDVPLSIAKVLLRKAEQPNEFNKPIAYPRMGAA